VIELRKKLFGVFLILLSMVIVSVSAFVYETAQHTVTQTIKDIATLTLQNSALGDIEEGATNFYTKSNASSLGNIVTVATTKDTDVYLHFNSDLDSNSSLSTYYATYTITVKYWTVPGGSSHSQGQTACTMSLGSADPGAVTLDKAGTWTFDFEISTTAKSVSSDAGTTVTIVVTAEST
jgi:Flp pilus assembly protein TadG